MGVHLVERVFPFGKQGRLKLLEYFRIYFFGVEVIIKCHSQSYKVQQMEQLSGSDILYNLLAIHVWQRLKYFLLVLADSWVPN